MKSRVQTLKADIAADAKALADIYAALHRYPESLASEEQLIAVAYHLHNCAVFATSSTAPIACT